jgi:hypothetical protein
MGLGLKRALDFSRVRRDTQNWTRFMRSLAGTYGFDQRLTLRASEDSGLCLDWRGYRVA